jgi:synapsin
MSTVSGAAAQKTPARTQAQSSVTEDAEDTMKNLRKTFAGIFGDM